MNSMKSYIPTGLSATPEVLRRLMDAIPASAWDTPTHGDRFSPREIIAHMADWEPILRDERMARAIQDPGCTIVAYDEGTRSIEQGYGATDVLNQLSRFAAERARTNAWLGSLSDEDLSKTFVHPETGTWSVGEFAANMLGHDMYHVEQLTAVLERG